MSTIPAGTFWMGSENGLLNESPRHRVVVGAFELAIFQVTNAEYAEFLAATGHEVPRDWKSAHFDDPQQPVCGVSWIDAKAFCDWLGGDFHLPTEAQREWAARGGVDGTEYPFGNDPPPLEGIYAPVLDGVKTGFPQPVGQGPANAFGLFNIFDNVHEWCADWYAADYYKLSPRDEPRGPATGTRRCARGGSWRHQVKFSRNAARSALDPTKRFTDFGFRVARSAGFEYVP